MIVSVLAAIAAIILLVWLFFFTDYIISHEDQAEKQSTQEVMAEHDVDTDNTPVQMIADPTTPGDDTADSKTTDCPAEDPVSEPVSDNCRPQPVKSTSWKTCLCCVFGVAAAGWYMDYHTDLYNHVLYFYNAYVIGPSVECSENYIKDDKAGCIPCREGKEPNHDRTQCLIPEPICTGTQQACSGEDIENGEGGCKPCDDGTEPNSDRTQCDVINYDPMSRPHPDVECSENTIYDWTHYDGTAADLCTSCEDGTEPSDDRTQCVAKPPTNQHKEQPSFWSNLIAWWQYD